MNNLLMIFGTVGNAETLIVWANIKEGYALEVIIANHYRFADLGFDETGMDASCARFNAGKSMLNRHSAIAAFRAGLKYL